jgi:HK97 gp10 family phage protein
MAKKRLKIDFKDVRQFEKKIRQEASNSRNNIEKGLFKAVTLVHREAVNNTRAGVKYTDGVYEVGNLRRSLSFDIISPVAGQVFISKGLKYPSFVELGTKRMRAKPFLSLAVYDNMEKVREIFKAIINQTFKNLK